MEQGYTPLVIRNMLKDLGALGRWIQERDLQPGALTREVIAEFRNDCLVSGRRKVPSVKSFEPLVRFLRSEGVLAEPPAPESAVDRLLVDYRGWLVAERGLAEAAVIRYENLARRFLHQHVSSDGAELEALNGTQVVSFLLHESERVSVGS